tara:strand:+ start:416 stop:616 length:201 start_codon:yes stop_codon:yes gene_type:complete
MLERIERELLKTVPDVDCEIPEDVAAAVFQNVLDADGNLQHDLNYGLTDEESLWQDFRYDTILTIV